MLKRSTQKTMHERLPMNDKSTTPAAVNLSFEKALSRLEEILETMTLPDTPLETAVALFEEADKLTKFCNECLEKAGKRVEMLMKNRTGELLLDAEGRPVTAEFLPPLGSRS